MTTKDRTGESRKKKHEQHPDGFYVEPKWLTTELLKVERFVGSIYDPACGTGNIVKAAQEVGYHAFGTDFRDRSKYGVSSGRLNFLAAEDQQFLKIDNIICNPPFQHAEAFIRRALELANHKVAMFLRLAFLEGVGRWKDLYPKTPFARLIVSQNRISMLPQDLAEKQDPSGGARAFAWFVWDKDHEGPATIKSIGRPAHLKGNGNG